MDNQIENARNVDMKINLGLLAASFAVIISLLQVEKLDGTLLITLICFSAILPINIYFGFLYQLIADRWQINSKSTYFSEKISEIFTYVALLGAGVGFLALLDHLSRIGFYAFIYSLWTIIVVFCISRVVEERKIKRHRRKTEKSIQPVSFENIEEVDKPETQEDQAPKKKKSKKKNKDEEHKK